MITPYKDKLKLSVAAWSIRKTLVTAEPRKQSPVITHANTACYEGYGVTKLKWKIL